MHFNKRCLINYLLLITINVGLTVFCMAYILAFFFQQRTSSLRIISEDLSSSIPTIKIEKMNKERYKLLNDQYFDMRKTILNLTNAIHPLWAKYDANWPCIWSENVIGNEYGDGIKWGCGLQLLQSPCIVYSFGCHNEWRFEEGIIKIAPHCKIFTFDPKFPKRMISMPPSIQKNTKYFEIGVSGHNFTNIYGKDPIKYESLPRIMNAFNHTHIDVLKVDIEGFEWLVFSELEKQFTLESNKRGIDEKCENEQQKWPSIGQILIEFHLGTKYQKLTFGNMIQLFENHGFRIFHKEVNAPWADCCSEYSFIQEKWQPSIKHYPMCGSIIQNITQME